MNRVSILGSAIDNLTLEEALNRIDGYIKTATPGLVVTANPEIIWLARHDIGFGACLKSAKIVTADGIGVIIASKIVGQPIGQRITGIDLITALFKKGVSENYTFYFLGGQPGIAEKAAENVRRANPGIRITGVQHGYFKDEKQIMDDIADKRPDVLLVALGMGRQEEWIADKALKLGATVGIGVGGSFDVLSGQVKRAPRWMQKAGIEWLYRLATQPSRIGRMLQLPKFLVAVLFERLKG